MSDKKLLAENTVRRFMKLANVGTLTDNFVAEAYKKDDKDLEEGKHGNKADKELEEATLEEAEEEVVEEELELYEQEEEEMEMPPEPEMDMEPEMDSEPEMDDDTMGEADISLTEEEAQLLIDLGERLKEAMGDDMSTGAMADEDPAPELSDADDDEMDDEEMDDDEETMTMQEEIVNEVLKRVTQRLVREKMSRN